MQPKMLRCNLRCNLKCTPKCNLRCNLRCYLKCNLKHSSNKVVPPRAAARHGASGSPCRSDLFISLFIIIISSSISSSSIAIYSTITVLQEVPCRSGPLLNMTMLRFFNAYICYASYRKCWSIPQTAHPQVPCRIRPVFVIATCVS